jgi:superfamily I DNA/RNA helicase
VIDREAFDEEKECSVSLPRMDHILVDEFQDTNDVQYKLMKLLLRSDTSIYVVGDPDQTIYTWRGANQTIILNFEKEYPNVETIILNENYRSTKTILDAANKLIANNKKRVPKPPNYIKSGSAVLYQRSLPMLLNSAF